MIIDYEDYLEAGWYIFALYPIENGQCGCQNPDCHAAGKHPMMANYQHVTTWDEEQLAFMTDADGLTGRNQLLDGFGVNLAGRIFVVDVDARNGGVESFGRLCKDIGVDLLKECGFVVRTGSGNGSMHLYFLAPSPPISLVSSLKEYKGVDFKSTGFVVGCGSMHISGDRYEAISGSPGDANDVPAKLIDLLRRPERLRTFESGRAIDFDLAELDSVVGAIANDGRDYEKWIRVGMGIHEATGGSQDGYDMWHRWSSKSSAHDDSLMPMKWHSFGKGGSSVVTLGTLLLWAREGGYSEPVSFDCEQTWEPVDEPEDESVTSKSVRESVNLKRPPGIVGEIAEWINSRSLFPRENLAVGAALIAVSSAAGLRYRVEGTNTTLNQIMFCIASSSTGKESIMQRLLECYRACGIMGAVHGSIKSEQEIIRNMLRNQAAFYVMDEIGETLSKLNNAKKKGGTAYLETVMATVMSTFSKANGIVPIGGDAKEEMRERVHRDIARCEKKLSESGPNDALEKKIQNLLLELNQVNDGIVNPFLSLYGTAEPHEFSKSIDRGMMVGGFMGRAVVLEEPENVPEQKDPDQVSSADIPDRLVMVLNALYCGGYSAEPGDRVERKGDICHIKVDARAKQALHEVNQYWRHVALAEQDSGTGLEPLALRAWETTIKVAGTLAVSGGVITWEHVRYANALVHRSTFWKLDKAKAAEGAETKDSETRSEGVLAAVRSTLSKEKEQTEGVIRNRYRNQYTRDQIDEALKWMVSQGIVSVTERKGKNGRGYVYYRLN